MRRLGRDGADVANAVCIGAPASRTCACAPGYAAERTRAAAPTSTSAPRTTAAAAPWRRTAAPTCRAATAAIASPATRGTSSVAAMNIDECKSRRVPCATRTRPAPTPTAASRASARPASAATARSAKTSTSARAARTSAVKDGTARCVNTTAASSAAACAATPATARRSATNIDECEDTDLNDCADERDLHRSRQPKDNPVGYECACGAGLAGDGAAAGTSTSARTLRSTTARRTPPA